MQIKSPLLLRLLLPKLRLRPLLKLGHPLHLLLQQSLILLPLPLPRAPHLLPHPYRKQNILLSRTAQTRACANLRFTNRAWIQVRPVSAPVNPCRTSAWPIFTTRMWMYSRVSLMAKVVFCLAVKRGSAPKCSAGSRPLSSRPVTWLCYPTPPRTFAVHAGGDVLLRTVQDSKLPVGYR